MIREELSQKIAAALNALVASGRLPAADYSTPEIADTKNPEHGDYACNIALTASKKAGMNPRDFGVLLLEALAADSDLSAELAGPGFLNLRLRPQFISDYVARILSAGTSLARSPSSGKKINVEYVSVNPNGPITVGSGRGAAFGSCLANVLEAAGNAVHREYYINDGVNSEQMRLFAESVRYYCQRAAGMESLFPEKGYRGDYVERVATEARMGAAKWIEILDILIEMEDDWAADVGSGKRSILTDQDEFTDHERERREAESEVRYHERRKRELEGVREAAVAAADASSELIESFGHSLLVVPTEGFQKRAQQIMLETQMADLSTFGVVFDTWFSEQSLHDRDVVRECIADLEIKGLADAEPFRLKLKMNRGGTVAEVERETQRLSDEDQEYEDRDLGGYLRNQQDEDVPFMPEGLLAVSQQSSTLWLRSTKFADDMDRVLRRRDGRLTYIASDVAYHRDKLTDSSGVRGTGPVDKMITILGPDHHGYIGRLTAVVAALLEKTDPVPLATSRRTEDLEAGESRRDASGIEEGLSEIEAQIYRSPEERDACLAALQEAKEKLEVVIFQIVRFVKEGKPAPMRKRDGNIYALIDLVDELGKAMAPDADKTEQQRIGRDVARFFYLMRSHETHMDFDIDLATKQSDENPVFYVQYAHARICSVIDKAKEAGISADYASADFALLQDPRELSLIKKILDLPFEVRRCAEDYGVHRLTTFAVELARTYHHFYDGCRVVQTDQPALSQARMALCEAARIGLKGVFDILGISAPERMERTVEATS